MSKFPPSNSSGAGRPDPGTQDQPKARYIMIGGFLGAGKTTAVGRLAQQLNDGGLRVGLITNDQGQNLVDTAMLRAQGFATEEIAGGCFCCRFNSLLDASRALTANARPEVFIAEPVGSCTDLVATVTYPLRRMYGDQYSIAPLSVLLDPVRARRALGLDPGPGFSPKVLYIYERQLEEADLLVIGKCDLLHRSALEELQVTLRERYPRAEILAASPRTGEGLDAWFEKILSAEQKPRPAMQVDYEVYADGEALLGWLNATIEVRSEKDFDANHWLEELGRSIQDRLALDSVEIAHLKMTLSPSQGLGEIAVANLVRNDWIPELSIRLDHFVPGGQLILNLRAEAAPEVLAAAVRAALDTTTTGHPPLSIRVEHLEHFRPGRPQPTHRDG